MGNLVFPQLSSGALAQYPIKKTKTVRTIKNVMQDGSILTNSDPFGSHLVWQLVYTELDDADIQALQTHFAACSGPLYGFTFIDPTDNMLVSSSDLTKTAWQMSPLVQLTAGIADPSGGSGAVTVTNTSQASEQIAQVLKVPANYQYCFSVYAKAGGADR